MLNATTQPTAPDCLSLDDDEPQEIRPSRYHVSLVPMNEETRRRARFYSMPWLRQRELRTALA